MAGELGKRAIRLPVAGAFHSPSMAPAVAPFRAALDEVELGEPRFTVFSCASAQPFEDVRDELARALIRPVRWRETYAALHEAGAERFIEVGPGKVLARLAKRIVPGTKVATPEDLATTADPDSRSRKFMPESLTTETFDTLNGMRAPARTARIVGLGHKLPDRVVPNGPIAERIGVDSDWIERRTGIRSRRYASPGERTSDLALAAAKRALSDAGIRASEIDLVLVATMTPDELTPNTAPLVAEALGLRVGAFDIGAACTGWLSALSVGAAQIETGRAQRVLVIGAETLSRLTNPDDKRTASLFGDGAGAVVLSPEGDGAIGPILLASDGSMGDTITANHTERLLEMDGHTTFNMAVKVLAESTRDAVEAAGLTLDDIDLFVYHQANGRILKTVGEKLDVGPERVADYVGETGNTSAASIPLTLSLLREDGRLRPGQRVLVSAVGAGFTWGAGVVEWGVR